MAVWNLLPQVPSVVTTEQLTALGFVNVPDGYWQLKGTAFGDSQPSTDHTTIIPLVGKAFKNAHSSNDSGNLSHNMAFSINGVSAMAGTARKIGTGYGSLFSDIQSSAFFYPYFYGYDLTEVMENVMKVTDDSSASNTNYTRTCVGIYLWLELATSTNLTNSRGMNFPAGAWSLATSSTSSDDIPLLVTYSGSGRNPDASLNGVGIAGWWAYKTNGTGTGLTYGTYDPKGYGLFLPVCYGYDFTAVQAARSTIEADSRFTITAWLHRS